MNIVLKFLGPLILGVTALLMILGFANMNIDLMIYLSYGLFFAVLIAVLLAFVLKTIVQPTSILTFAIGAVAMLILYFIAGAFSAPSNAEVTTYAAKISKGNLSFVSSAITVTFWILAISFIVSLLSEIYKAVK